MKLPFTLNWTSILVGSLPLIGLLGAIYGVYNYGYGRGENAVQSEWNKEKLSRHDATKKVEGKIELKEDIHAGKSQEITNELSEAKARHARTVAQLNAAYAERLRRIEERDRVYRAQSTAGAAEQARLASHAAELDRALEEGIHLVDELQATLGQREDELKLLGAQIISDRQLMEQTDAQRAAPTK